jgi:hypothetical protein
MKVPSVVRLLLFGAGTILLAYAVCHLLGLRETTGLLSRVDLQAAPHAGEVIGFLLYLGSYAGAILIAPILLLAAGMIWLHDRIRASKHREDGPPGATTP